MQYKRIPIPELNELVDWHNRNSTNVTLDLETTGLNHFTDTITGIGLSGRDPSSSILVDLDERTLGAGLVAALGRLRVPRLVLHNFKFDFHMAYRAGLDLRNCCRSIRDTMLMHHLLDENLDHDLDTIVTERYGDRYKAAFWSQYKTFQDAPEVEQTAYACKDILYTSRLYTDLSHDLCRDHIPDSLIDHTHRLALTLFDTEVSGLRVDPQYLLDVGLELKPKIAQFQQEMRALVAPACESVSLDIWAKDIAKLYKPKGKKWLTLPQPEFNFDSHQHVTRLLYEKLSIPPRFNKARNWTVDDAALEGNKFAHPVIPMIQEYRGYQKVYTAFIEGVLDRMRDERIYPQFNVNGTVTGRISSSDPNMHQLPSKGEWSKVRGIYIPEPGHKLLTCDYAQLEVVIAAHFSQDPNLLKIIHEGASKHDITAAGVGLPRGIAKTLNFAMQYQCTPRKVQQIVGCTPQEAQHIWDKYWETYAGEKAVIDACNAAVDNGEPIVNPFGRKRRFPTHFAAKWQREAAYRQAYSSLIQGTGADCTHESFYITAETMVERGLGKALFEIHDEIVAMPKIGHIQESQDLLGETMIGVGRRIGLTVPLGVECSEALERWAK